MKQTTTIKIVAQSLRKNKWVPLALVLISITFSVKHTIAQNVTIPDANFKAALVANNAINTNADSEIDYSEAAAFVGTMDVSSLSISDLTGIEAFTSLPRLDCGFNNLTNLDLSYNVSLSYVDCSSNSLANLNVYGLTTLDTLICVINNLTCLDLHTNTGLMRLNCGTNNLTSLNLKNGNNAALTYMNALSGGGMLYCIQVDNPAASASYPQWYEDTWSTYTLVCGTSVSASYTHNAPVCLGTPVAFTNTSTGIITYYSWYFDDGTGSNVANPLHSFGAGAGYWVRLAVGNCNQTDTIAQTVFQGNDLTGNVTYSGGPVTSGTAVLMPFIAGYQTFDTLYTSPLGTFGDYTFPHVVDGSYIVKVFPDTVMFPTLVPSYYDNNIWAWDTAALYTQGCFVPGVADIAMFELTPNGSGPGGAAGLVLEGPGFGRAQGDPIHGVDVKLGITGSSSIVASTETDTNGVYTFTNINYGSYTVYVDIPGLYRSPLHQFTIDSTNTIFSNLVYYVDSVHVYPLFGIGVESYDDLNLNSLEIYPNPTKDQSNINFTLVNDANVKLEVMNIYGMKIQTLINAHMDSGDYTTIFNPKDNALRSGVYMVTLTVNGKSRTIRTIVME